MEFDIGQHLPKEKSRRLDENCLRSKNKNSSLSINLALRLLLKESVCLSPNLLVQKRKKMKNLKKSQEAIFNLSNKIREILTKHDQLNIEIELKDLLVNKIYHGRINLISDLTSTILKCQSGNRKQLKFIITRTRTSIARLIREQQRLRYPYQRIEDSEKQLEKSKKNSQQEEMLIQSIMLTFNQNCQKLQKFEESKTLKEIEDSTLPIQYIKENFFEEISQKNKFSDSLSYQRDRENQLRQKIWIASNRLKVLEKAKQFFQTFIQILLLLYKIFNELSQLKSN